MKNTTALAATVSIILSSFATAANLSILVPGTGGASQLSTALAPALSRSSFCFDIDGASARALFHPSHRPRRTWPHDPSPALELLHPEIIPPKKTW